MREDTSIKKQPLNCLLTPEQVRDIRVSTESIETLAKLYGVSKSVIRGVQTASSYQSVEGISQVPAAPSEQIHVLIDIPDRFNAITAEGNICRIESRSAERELLWRILFDEETKAFYVEPVISPCEFSDLAGFLERAWSRKADLLFVGEPTSIRISKRTLYSAVEIESWLSSKKVRLYNFDEPSGSFVGAATIWIRCMVHLFNPDEDEIEISPDQLKEMIKPVQVAAFAVGWYQRHGKNPYKELGRLIYPDELGMGISFVNSPVYLARAGINDYVERFKDFTTRE
jgi:hypothetical protein